VGEEFNEKFDLRNYRSRVVVIDIDGVLAEEQYNISLEERQVVSEAREALELFQQKGYKIILFTSRVRQQEKATVDWLIKNDMIFDDIMFGKPRGALYIDDRGYRFKGWKQFLEDVEI
jgi:ribonucleotide monophosphatase NagD (HAD superfamily)